MRRTALKYIALISLTIVFSVPTANAAKLYFYPETIDVIAGGSFVVELRLDTEGELVNAVDISGNVSNGLIESITTANSLIEIFIDASVSNGNTFRFAGGTPNGFTGSGIVGRLNITSVAPGQLTVQIDDVSKLLSGTGVALNNETKLRSATINALQPNVNQIIITSKSHPNQNKWYSAKDLQLHWDLEEDIEYSYLISQDPAAVPDDTADKPSGTLIWQGDINIGGLEEGIYYFTLKRVGEEGIARYRAMIDATPPEWIAFEVSEGVPETQYNKFITFIAKDVQSGINRYEAEIDGGDPIKILAPYILPDDYLKITISAIDNAGNKISQTTTSSAQRNIITLYIVVAVIVLGALITLVRPIGRRILTKGE